MKFLPDVTWPVASLDTAGLAPREAINSTASSTNKQNLVLVSQGAPVRIVLGIDRIGADVLNVIAHGGYLIVQAIWSYAPGSAGIQGITGVTFNDSAVPATVQSTNYLGTPTQGVDPWLSAAFSAAGKVYSDTLPNIAYTVFKIPEDVVADLNLPNISAIIYGAKLYDPRTGTRVHTSNPSVILAGFINESWGMGQPINWSTVITCANADDALVGGKPRRTLGLTLDRILKTDQWLETLRTYASCWVVPGDSGAELIPDQATASSRVISHANGDIKQVNFFELRDIANTPNVVRVTYTDTSEVPWRRDAYAEVALPEVALGAPRRESVISLEGFHDYSEALRVATERLNKLTLSDLTMELVMFDEGVQVKVGDVVTVTTDFGITSKPFRVLTTAHNYGDCTLGLSEYDPAVYSNVVGTAPTYSDIGLPSPNSPPSVTGLSSVEELYTLRDGSVSSRLAITWSAVAFLWLDSYYVEVYQGSDLLWSGNTLTPEFRTGAVQDNVSLTVNVFTVSRVGVVSAPTTVVVNTLGKYALPTDVPYVRGYEVGGEVRLELGPSIDKDLRGLEVRYGPVGATWAAGKFVDFVPTAPGVGARLLSKIIPAGTWDIMCCALDSVGQYSAIPARLSISVTSDAAAFLADTHTFTNPTTSNMAEFSLGPGDTTRRFVSEDNVMFGTKFSNNLSTYANPLASYCSVSSAITTESWDFGVTLGGDWTGEATYTDLAGTADFSVRLSSTSITGPWTTYTPAAARTTARYGHLVIVAGAGESFYFELVNTNLRINAVPRTEYSKTPLTSNASTYTRVTLENDYVALKGPPKVTVLGTTAATCTVDNIQTGNPTTFDVYIFSSAGVQVARDFMWEFNGV